MKRLLQIMLILLVLLGLGGCKLFKKPTVDRIHDIRIVSMTPDQTNLLISVKINNPNSYKLVVREMTLKLMDKDRVQVGTATMNAKIMIPGRKSTAIDFSVNLETRKATRMISHADQILFFYIEGVAKGSALGFGKTIRFEEPYGLDIRDYISRLLPSFKSEGENLFVLQRTKIEQWGLSSTTIGSEFIILNPFGLSFRFKEFPAEVYINQRLVGTAGLQEPLSFTEDVYSRNGKMVMRVSNFRSIINALGGVIKGEIEYKIKGNVVIEAFGMEIRSPYEYMGKIPFDVSELIF